jgi:hypothetical protein
MFTAQFWVATAERAVKTFAQAFLSFIVVGTTGLLTLDYGVAASVSGAAALASVLTSLVSSSINGPGPSLAGEALPTEGGRNL